MGAYSFGRLFLARIQVAVKFSARRRSPFPQELERRNSDMNKMSEFRLEIEPIAA